MENETLQLLKDYSRFRLFNSPIKQEKLEKFPCGSPSSNAKKLRYLAHHWATEVKKWPQLTDNRDFAIQNFFEFHACVSRAFENITTFTAKHVYAFFEFTSVCCVFAVSTAINGENVDDICSYASQFLQESEKFQRFLYQQRGWTEFLSKEYNKSKIQQESLFDHWLATLSEDQF